MKKELTRREVVRCASLAVCAPLLGQMACARRVEEARTVRVPGPVNGNLRIPRALVGELNAVDGHVLVKPAHGAPPVLLVRTGNGILALGAICPHSGCELTWVPEDGQAECPCHGSRFSAAGTVLNPPARDNVPVYPVELDYDSSIVIHLQDGDGVFPPVVDGRIVLRLADYPALQGVGGSLSGKPKGLGTTLLVERIADAQIVALDATCTHAQCNVRPEGNQLLCPCHGSTFSTTGEVRQGPATRSLRSFPVQFDGAQAIVTVA